MKFTYSEKSGSKPISEWLVNGLKYYAKKEHGIKLNVKAKEKTTSEK